jgi:hypothetical protein
MSADSWATCPRCKANDTIGFRGTEFREDYEIGLNDPEAWGEGEEGKEPCIILYYRGKCQSCDLKVEVHERFPVPDWRIGTPVVPPTPEPNKPTGFIVTKAWNQIPVGWFVRAPKGAWYEVASNKFENGRQMVGLRFPPDDDDVLVWPRDPDEKVVCRRGSLASQAQAAAMEALGEGATILQDGVQ